MDTFTDGNGAPFDLEKVYTVATTNFLTLGKDGFEAFLDPEVKSVCG